MLPVALYLDTHDIDKSDINSADSVGPLMNRFLSRSRGLFFLDTRDLWMDINAKSIVFDIAKPTPAEQGDAWSLALNGIDTKLSKLLAAQLRPYYQNQTQRKMVYWMPSGKNVWSIHAPNWTCLPRG